MKNRAELESLIQSKDTQLQTCLLKTIENGSNHLIEIPKEINEITNHKAELISELNKNIEIAELTKYEVENGTKRINTFLRLEGITHAGVIYHFISKDKDFRDITSKIAYGSYKSINMNKDLLEIVLNTFKSKGY